MVLRSYFLHNNRLSFIATVLVWYDLLRFFDLDGSTCDLFSLFYMYFVGSRNKHVSFTTGAVLELSMASRDLS